MLTKFGNNKWYNLIIIFVLVLFICSLSVIIYFRVSYTNVKLRKSDVKEVNGDLAKLLTLPDDVDFLYDREDLNKDLAGNKVNLNGGIEHEVFLRDYASPAVKEALKDFKLEIDKDYTKDLSKIRAKGNTVNIPLVLSYPIFYDDPAFYTMKYLQDNDINSVDINEYKCGSEKYKEIVEYYKDDIKTENILLSTSKVSGKFKFKQDPMLHSGTIGKLISDDLFPNAETSTLVFDKSRNSFQNTIRLIDQFNKNPQLSEDYLITVDANNKFVSVSYEELDMINKKFKKAVPIEYITFSQNGKDYILVKTVMPISYSSDTRDTFLITSNCYSEDNPDNIKSIITDFFMSIY